MKEHINTAIIALSIVITGYLVSQAWQYRYTNEERIRVKGLGSKDFNADLIVWSGSFSKKSLDLKEAYTLLDLDRESIKKYMITKGLELKQLVFSSITIEKLFDDVYDDNGNKIKSTFNGYQLRQTLQVESKEVDKVELISREVSELIHQGIEFYSQKPEYYYTKLAELKIEMIATATKDAQSRAKKIADNAGSSLGKLTKAEMGVFQIIAQNSSEDFSWGGSFNTSSKRKTANITVNLEYSTR